MFHIFFKPKIKKIYLFLLYYKFFINLIISKNNYCIKEKKYIILLIFEYILKIKYLIFKNKKVR
jgi:hypothetical protein